MSEQTEKKDRLREVGGWAGEGGGKRKKRHSCREGGSRLDFPGNECWELGCLSLKLWSSDQLLVSDYPCSLCGQLIARHKLNIIHQRIFWLKKKGGRREWEKERRVFMFVFRENFSKQGVIFRKSYSAWGSLFRRLHVRTSAIPCLHQKWSVYYFNSVVFIIYLFIYFVLIWLYCVQPIT